MNAAFVSIDQNYREKLRVVYGVRYENVAINVNNQKLNTPIAEIKEGNVLPSVNATYFLTEKSNKSIKVLSY